MKMPNNDARVSAEALEGRTPAKGNPEGQSTRRTQRRASVSQAADRVRQAARRNPEERLTALVFGVTDVNAPRRADAPVADAKMLRAAFRSAFCAWPQATHLKLSCERRESASTTQGSTRCRFGM